MDLNEILVFVRVAQMGSFNKAAEVLGMPNSTVSFKVSALEARLGVTLLHRTTRKLSLTDVGQDFYAKSLQHIEGLVRAEHQASAQQEEASGTLRVTAPIMISTYLMPMIIKDYLYSHPQVHVELIASDETEDLVAENIDLAIRAGRLQDSNLRVKKVGEVEFAGFVSCQMPKTKRPNHPKDLLDLMCIHVLPLGKDKWEFTHLQSQQKTGVVLKHKITVNDLAVAKQLALQNLGVAILPTIICRDEVKTKDLVRVMPQWIFARREMSFVYPEHKFMSRKLAEFMAISETYFKKLCQ